MVSRRRHSRRVCAILACFIATALSHALPLQAAWLEASTDHFIIYTEDDQNSALNFATRLEKYDSALRRLFPPPSGEAEGRQANRLRVYVVANAAAVRKLAGGRNDGLLGFYIPRAFGSIAFTPRTEGHGSQATINEWNVLLHEYAHHFMFRNFKAAYPAWFKEGFAEFCATAQFAKDGSINFGMPAYGRGRSLAFGRVVPMHKLMDVSAREANHEVRETLYARGWLLTHFLNFKPERRSQLGVYLQAFNSGTPSIDAAKLAFGDLKQLDAELDKYLRGPLSYVPMRPDKLVIGEIAVRPLSEGESSMMPVHLRSTRGIDRKAALQLIPEARRIASKYPDDAVVQVQLAEAELDAGNLLEAEAAADRSLGQDPRNLQALIYKGHIVASRAAQSKDVSGWAAARSWYVKANAVDPKSAAALMYFYDTFKGAGVEPSNNANDALGTAFELAPEAPELRARFAMQALDDEKLELARAALAPLAYEPHSGGFSERAYRAMRLIENGSSGDALRVLSGVESLDEDSDK